MPRTGLINPGQGCSGSLAPKSFQMPSTGPWASSLLRPPSVLPVWVPSAPAVGSLFLPIWTTFLERFSPVPIHGPTVHPQSPLGRTAHPVWEANACHLPGVPGCRDPGGPASSVPAPPGPALRLPALPWRRGQQSQPRATRAARLWAGPQREGGACAVHPGLRVTQRRV